MSSLWEIKNTAQDIAEAITAAIGIEVEIIDDQLMIVAGTGRYTEKIGQREEEGNIDSGYIYSHILKTGEEYVVEDARHDEFYHACENELAEVCCPITSGNRIIGLIGLVAFTEAQRVLLLESQRELMIFLRRMAYLLSSKVSETKMSNELKSIIETIHHGIIAVDRQGFITLCNETAEKLIGLGRTRLLGLRLISIWPDSPVMEVISTGVGYKDREEMYRGHSHAASAMHFFTTVTPILSHQLPPDSQVVGAVISFRDAADVRKLVYEITEKEEHSSLQEIIGRSEQIQEVKVYAEKVSQSNSTILITGESGTGKGLLAKAIHFTSPRKHKPLITVNCGAIPDTLLESELFGYEAGAFTGASKSGKVGKFELAQEGTIFLDEIGDMPLHLQVKLLHVLQHREIERVGGTRVIPVDVRVIAATSRNLEKMMQEGEFREDLYFRLSVIPIRIPSLFERKEDIPLLLHHALEKYRRLIGKEIRGFEQETMELLLNYHWPGNIRELENAVEYAVNMETESAITPGSIPERILKLHRQKLTNATLKTQLNVFEKQIIERYLREMGSSVESKIRIARRLGISESTLYRRIRELGIHEKPPAPFVKNDK
ncbi:sigma 54-interacting transcriptional regulator [Brevibacillus ruminantium]|uniref:Sigma 54-interacting transcriptional regulator n=1 Tax=Brevibacillus ruminantium TaxID=2950604 RepID=A0ABY4WID8_9BACL|nr:sigma 54-interacting transcriptional regulator [Brevibacillus ruminantium]USG66639.1 sigma 54-interacting transcriptional regulator [Brevibacillus ruminantium]